MSDVLLTSRRRRGEVFLLVLLLGWVIWTLPFVPLPASLDAVKVSEPQSISDSVFASEPDVGGEDLLIADDEEPESKSSPQEHQTNHLRQDKDSSPAVDESNVHYRLNALAKQLGNKYSSIKPRHFAHFSVPHFVGGWRQFVRSLEKYRNWTLHSERELESLIGAHRPYNLKVDMLKPKAEKYTYDLVLTPCSAIKPGLHSLKHQRFVGAVSGDPKEQQAVLKGNFYLATRRWYNQSRPGCDYRHFHPETHYLGNRQTCLQFNKSLVEPGELWFLKTSSRASFGMGIATIRQDTVQEKLDCDTIDFSIAPRLMQRGVENIVTFEGRITQGRAYLLISSYQPTRAWFFMGYFNVAAGKSHITNTGANQGSDRITFATLLQGKSLEELLLIKHHIKSAALELFHVITGDIIQDEHSFSLFGFDYVIQQDLSVKVLEANCNCELFFNLKDFGPIRYQSSSNLVDTMMDLVIASNMDEVKEEFDIQLTRFVDQEHQALRNDTQSNELDQFGVREYWELLYSSSSPQFAYKELGKCV
ncbi:hypothetical protein BASA81_008110 [Batrachochytrium salamandrivorans]|nr:hypothetical protein BASA81_008110 [Batrachochytrium salamandrivorans]